MENFVISGTSGLPIQFDIHYAVAKEKAPLVIFLHGFKGFKDWGQWPILANELAQKGLSVVRMSFSHNGTTPDEPKDFADLEAFGNNTFSKEVQDVQDVLNWIEQSSDMAIKVDQKAIHLLAHSRGGAIALTTICEDQRIKSVATLSGVGTLVRFSEEELAYWKKQGVAYSINGRTGQHLPMYYSLAQDYLDNKERFEPQFVVPQLKKPYLIIHAEEDETVLLAEAKEMFNLGDSARLAVIPGANHSFGGMHPYSENFLPSDTQKAMDIAFDFFIKGA